MMLLTGIKIFVASELIHNMSVMGHKWRHKGTDMKVEMW